MTMYSKKMRKVSVSWARAEYPKAKNNGERAELLTLMQFYCTQYNPTLKGSLGGDVYGPTCGHMQVKYFNGRIAIPAGATGDIPADLRRALDEDASPTWVIWSDLDTYAVFTKDELYSLLTNKLLMEELIEETKDQKGVTTLRLKMGPGKTKYFMNKLQKRTASVG